SGIIESPLLNGSIYAWGIHQPGESYYAQADLHGAYYPKITPFTEVTLSGKVSAQLTGIAEDASSSFSTASMSITFGRQTFWRYISLRGDVHTLDEEFSLTFTNDTAQTLDFDWHSYAQVNAPIPEPSQSTMLVLGFGLLGLLRHSRLALRPNMRHSESSYDSMSSCA
ncbi:MAG TPA: PEP-CTERM sorting domain-containing protein, partial [Pseudoduganella sp.]